MKHTIAMVTILVAVALMQPVLIQLTPVHSMTDAELTEQLEQAEFDAAVADEEALQNEAEEDFTDMGCQIREELVANPFITEEVKP